MSDQYSTVRVREARLLERPVRLRLPFRYGAVTLREAPQAFVHLRLETPAGEAWGTAAELLAPKWFDKSPALSDEDNADQLRRSLRLAAAAYGAAGAASAFELAAGAGRDAREAGIADGLPALAAGFGPALLDRAVLDALCHAAGLSLFQAMAANLPGADLATLAPDLGRFDSGAFLASLRPLPRIHARHTVGLLDALTAAEADERPDDGLPATLEAAIARYANRYFKVKLGGDPDADRERLGRVAAVLDASIPDRYHVTLDANEQYTDLQAAAALLDAIRGERRLARFFEAIRLVEQPLARERALDGSVDALGHIRPVIIDESDDDLDAFPRARALGYSGVSSKQCKGLWKSLVNLARCARWNAERAVPRYLLSAEDLSCQGGVSVQQDLALCALLGIPHCERNGHFYGGAMPGATAAEHRAFLAAHPDLYEDVGGAAALRIRGGTLDLGSLHAPGFAHAADPDFDAMAPLGGD